MNISKILQDALARHQAGDLDSAEALYRKIIAKKPKTADAHNLLGVLLQQRGDLAGAIEHCGRAAKLDPDFHVPHVNLGNALQAAGRFEDARDAFARADRLQPNQPEILNNLASVFNALGAHQDALNAANQAMRNNPNLGEAYNNEGNALLGLGRAEDALVSFERAQALGAPALDVFFNIAQARLALGRFDEARAVYLKLIEASPDDARLWFGRGNADLALDDFDAAIDAFTKALQIDPSHTAARCNLAAARQAAGDTGAAIADLTQALAAEPGAADLRWNLALAKLQAGDYAGGWADYRARWEMPAFQGLKRTWWQADWDGADPSGKTILIRAEQGFGDALMVCRFAPRLAARGAQVIIECRPPLTRLLATLDGVSATVDLDPDTQARGTALPDHDLQVPLMDLPHLFGATLDDLPTNVPYLAPPMGTEPPAAVAQAQGFKVGIAWEGSATRDDNHKRSLTLDRFGPLLATPGTRFFSLQVGPGAAAAATFDSDHAEERRLVNLSDNLTDFAETAAAVAALDLVVTVDTAVFHLAGALGKPVWGLLSRPCGYLYGTEGKTHPWYPTARLYRQPVPGDWQGVFDAVAQDITAAVTAGA